MSSSSIPSLGHPSCSLIDASIATYFHDFPTLRILVIFCRVLFSIGVALLVAGSSLEGQYTNPDRTSNGLKLVKAGYVVVLVIFATLIAFKAYFWTKAAEIGRSGKLVSP